MADTGRHRLVITGLIIGFLFGAAITATAQGIPDVRKSATCEILTRLENSNAQGTEAAEWYRIGYATAYISLSAEKMTRAITVGEFVAGLKSRCAARPFDTLYNIGQWILGLSQ